MSEGVNPKDLIGISKPRLSLVPGVSILHLAKAMEDGAAKYDPYNWRSNPVKMTIYIEAAQRHILALLDGEDIDPKSKVHHGGHAMACMAIILDAMETGNLVDDRPIPGASAKLIRDMTKEVPHNV